MRCQVRVVPSDSSPGLCPAQHWVTLLTGFPWEATPQADTSHHEGVSPDIPQNLPLSYFIPWLLIYPLVPPETVLLPGREVF